MLASSRVLPAIKYNGTPRDKDFCRDRLKLGSISLHLAEDGDHSGRDSAGNVMLCMSFTLIALLLL